LLASSRRQAFLMHCRNMPYHVNANESCHSFKQVWI
jgi:hypothetical protein